MIDYKKKVLENGLTVLAHKDSSTAHVALNIIYKVGSKDEESSLTGFAHLFEHLMFGGTKSVPSFDEPIQLASGENNAFTNCDYTNYYIVVPKNNVEVALYVEADRMQNLDINQKSLDVQKKVVEEEYNERYKNKPYGDLFSLLRGLSYTKHHYRWSTIGADIAHVRNASLSDVSAFYSKFYSPQNAIVALAGNIEPSESIALVEKYFASIPKGQKLTKENIIEPPQTEPRTLTVHRDVPASMIYISYRMKGRLARQFALCDMLSDLLSGGNSSRMYQNLIKTQRLFSSVNAYVSGDEQYGGFIVMGQLNDGVAVEVAHKALLDQIEEMKTTTISDYELEKVKNKFEVNTTFGEINVMNKAMNLCFYEMLGDIELINREIDNFRSITAEELRAEASELFVPENSSTLFYLKNE